jgi:beta-glucosidase
MKKDMNSFRSVCMIGILLFVVVEADGVPGKMETQSKGQEAMEERISNVIGKLTLDEKISLVHGASYMETKAIERVGIPALKMCDGPHGVRGHGKSTCFPTGIGMGATWNPALIHEVGEALGEEALGKGRNLLLGPCVNIHRVPVGGRNFESFSEDPYLAGALALGYVRGVQSKGVGTSIKHFAANNQEHNRMTISAVVDERALREIYLPAFERAVKEGDVWTVMAAYNRLNGTFCCANAKLLKDILKDEWGFEGLVMSDWSAVHGTAEYANNGLDLEMPGEGEFFGHGKLRAAVEAGEVAEETIDEMVRRILRVIYKMGLERAEYAEQTGAVDTPKHRRIARRVATESITLLKNEGNVLPLFKEQIKKLAVMGPNALQARPGGGGSSWVDPVYMISPLDGLREFCGEAVSVDYTPGAALPCDSEPIPSSALRPPTEHHGASGLLGEYFNNRSLEGTPVLTRVDELVDFNWGMGSPSPQVPVDYFSVRWTGKLVPPVSGEYTLALRSDDGSRLFLDDELVLDFWWDHGPECRSVQIVLEAGHEYDLRLEYYEAEQGAEIRLGWKLPGKELDAAVALARGADAAVIVVGISSADEGEGRDRADLKLPGDQAVLIRAVAAANPRTVVVYVGGTPLEMENWIEDVPAVLSAWYPGQEGGRALADIIFGAENPSGKLPVTFPKRLEDNPTYGVYPGGGPWGDVPFAEGVFTGYRYYDSKGVEPLFPFGHGLSYTTFEYDEPTVDNEALTVSVTVRNVGSRAGAEVVQLYVHDEEVSVERPKQELKRFQKIFLEPGEEKTVVFELDARALAYWDAAQQDWLAEPGRFELRVGSSSRDIRQRATLDYAP